MNTSRPGRLSRKATVVERWRGGPLSETHFFDAAVLLVGARELARELGDAVREGATARGASTPVTAWSSVPTTTRTGGTLGAVGVGARTDGIDGAVGAVGAVGAGGVGVVTLGTGAGGATGSVGTCGTGGGGGSLGTVGTPTWPRPSATLVQTPSRAAHASKAPATFVPNRQPRERI